MNNNREWGFLSRVHLAELRQSGIADTIIERNFATLTDPREIDQFLNRNNDRRHKHGDWGSGGWCVTGIEPQTGEFRGIGGQFKPDNPRTNKDGKPIKYESVIGHEAVPLFLDTGDRFFWKRVIADSLIPIVITEGAKKAGCVLSRGMACISIAGVTNGQKLGELREDLKLFCQLGRTVYLAFDMDLHSKPQVSQALDKLGRLLSASGCVVKVMMWNEAHKGIDDYLVNTGEPLVTLRDGAWTLEKWRQEFVTGESGIFPVTSEKEEKRAVADELIYLAIERSNITLWHTDDQDTYADILEGTVRQTLPIRDTSFRAWLRRQYFERHCKSPNDVAMAQAIATIESFALFDGAKDQVHLRTAEHNGRIYYDLGDTTWQAVEVSADGWRIVSDAPVRFRRTKSLLPLPVPTAGGTLADLRQFVNLSDDAWAMVVSFAINCLRPCANYPILILHGEAGSGKSTLSTLLKNLVDPSKAMLMPSISDLRNLSISAYNRHLLVYDNLSGINNEQSDALCRIATGASFSHRKLQTDIEETTLDFVRPQILNGIDALATRGDLLDRSYLIQLSKPPEKADLKQYWADFERLHPQLLGALFTALSQAMANLPTVEIEDLPRMAEYAKLGTALEPSLGLPLGQFMVIHREVRQESHHTAIESSPIAQAIVKLMENRLIWKGYYKDLLAELNVLETNDLIKKSKAWASDAIRLSKALTRIAPDLRALGIDVITSDPITKLKYQDRQGKYLLIEKLLKISSPSSPSSHPAQDKGLRRDDNGDDTKNLSSPNNGEQPKNIAGDDKNDDGDDTKNLSSPLEPAQRKGGDDSDDGDDKNSPSSSKDVHKQRSLLQEDRPKPTNHYQIEDGDQDEF